MTPEERTRVVHRIADGPIEMDLRDMPFVAHHNFPCPVCREREAVYRIDLDVFGQCWTCTGHGWDLRAPSPWVSAWLRRMLP